MQNTELRRRVRPVLDALRTLALQGRTRFWGCAKNPAPTIAGTPCRRTGHSPRLDTLCPR